MITMFNYLYKQSAHKSLNLPGKNDNYNDNESELDYSGVCQNRKNSLRVNKTLGLN